MLSSAAIFTVTTSVVLSAPCPAFCSSDPCSLSLFISSPIIFIFTLSSLSSCTAKNLGYKKFVDLYGSFASAFSLP
jgi:hypothetical protein